MSLTSINFLAFFLLVLLIYYIVPAKVKNLWLLIASYYFYASAGTKYLYVILGVSGITYIFGIIVEKTRNKEATVRKMLMAGIIVLSVSPLIMYKYLDMLGTTFASGMSFLNIGVSYQNLNFIMPLGISFFVLQAIGYLIDVYRGKIDAEKNMIHYFLFLGFFAYMLSGPIERASNILPQLRKRRKFNYKMLCHGLQLMLYGFFMKLIVAERLAIVANTVFNNYTSYSGFELLLGTIAYSLQLYMDFAGYSYIAQGTAQALGLQVMTNFEQPYLSRNIGEFWRRWHISLSSWFRDYIYIPLGGNRKGKTRKYLNVLIVFAVSGLWHGANWNYMIWGLLHGIYQVIGAILKPLKDKFNFRFKTNTEAFSYKLFQCIINFSLVNIAWIFFRAPKTDIALTIIKRIVCGWDMAQSFGMKHLAEHEWRTVTGLNLTSNQDSLWLHLGLEGMNLTIVLIGVLIVFMVDVIHYKKLRCREWIDKQNLCFRWLIYVTVIFIVLTYGIYGTAYNASSFIYSNF